MSGSLDKPARVRTWWRHSRRTALISVPVVVWVVTVVGAWCLHERVHTVASVTGYAESQPVTLAHLEPGLVREVHVELYETVTCGQVLLALDDRQERLELAAVEQDVERLRAEVEAARARLQAENAWATADVDDLARRFALDRETAHVDYLSQLADNARDRMTLTGTTAEYELVEKLHDRNSAPFRELNDIQTELVSLQAAVDRNAVVLARKKRAFEEADQRWGRFREHADVATPYEPALTPLRLAIEVRRRELAEIVRRLDDHVLRAPVDGQVTALWAHAGDRIAQGAPLAVISPTSTNRVVAYLPEQVIATAEVGASVSVACLANSPAGLRRFEGTVVSLSAAVDEAPPRYRCIPSTPVWGRGLVVSLAGDARLIPGEAVTVTMAD